MSTKFLVPLCAAVALLAACGKRDDTKMQNDTATPPAGDTAAPSTAPPPAETPPADTTPPPSGETPPAGEQPSNPPPSGS
jgi:hypothetical protein